VEQIHRDVDTAIFAAGEGEILKTVIVCPPLIYGKGTGLVGTRSQQIPTLTKAAIKKGKPVVVGKGVNIWSFVHVEDLGEFYFLLLEKLVGPDAKDVPVNKDGFFFVENGELTFGKIAEEIGKALGKELGKDLGEVENVDGGKDDLLEQVFGVKGAFVRMGTASNSRSRAVTGRKLLGWVPKRKDVYESIEDEVKYYLKEAEGKK